MKIGIGAALCLVFIVWTAAATPPPVGDELAISSDGAPFWGTDVSTNGEDGFAVVWSTDAGEDGRGVRARRVDVEGELVGAELVVNAYSTGDQERPRVAMGTDGGFLVVWASNGGQDGDLWSIQARFFDSSGAVMGGEFQVNTVTTDDQRRPDVALIEETGGFVVVWDSPDADSVGIFGQLFDSAGSPLAGEWQINTYTTNAQGHPKVVADAAGNFLVAWESDGQDGQLAGIFAQRYDSMGLALGGEFQVNQTTAGPQRLSGMAMDDGGTAAFVWNATELDIVARLYDSSGMPATGELELDFDPVPGLPEDPVVALDPGGFVVSLGVTYGAYPEFVDSAARRFDSQGNPREEAFLVNTGTSNWEFHPQIDIDDRGRFLVVWETFNPSGPSPGTRGQLFCSCLFADGFESGDTTSWSDSVP